MTLRLPEWAPAGQGAVPPLAGPGGPAGRVVAVVATKRAVSSGWVGEVTLELARGWCGAGARLVLADGGLTHPLLHGALGLPLGEGLVDALRWGASVKRVAVRPDGERFFAITAGTAVADGAPLMEAPRWGSLCSGFREAGVTLVVLVPGHDSCRSGVLSQASEAVLLTVPGEDPASLLEGWGGEVLAVLGRDPGPAPDVPAAAADPVPDEAAPWGAPPGPPAVPGPEPEPEAALAAEPEAPPAPPDDFSPWFEAEDAAAEEPASAAGWEEEAFQADLAPAARQGEDVAPEAESELAAAPEPGDDLSFAPDGSWGASRGASDAAGAAAAGPVPTFEEIVEEVGEPRARRGGGGGRRTLVLVLLVVILGALAAAWLGYLEIPGITPRGGAASEANGATPVPAVVATPVEASVIAAPPPAETAPAQPFSVSIGAFRDENTAIALAASLGARVEGVLFITAPVSVQGSVLHRVLAGPAADSASASALLARVGEASGLDPSEWVPRATPKAFQLGEMPGLDAARRRSEVLRGLGVPAYVLAVPFSDGSVRFRVYAGAYADEAEASHLAGLLQERGLNVPSLSDRTGRLPE